MGYYGQQQEPYEISIGSEFVTIGQRNSTAPPTIARILRRTDDAKGEPVFLVLDRRVGPHGAEVCLLVEHVSSTDKRTWRGCGCLATELSREGASSQASAQDESEE